MDFSFESNTAAVCGHVEADAESLKCPEPPSLTDERQVSEVWASGLYELPADWISSVMEIHAARRPIMEI